MATTNGAVGSVVRGATGVLRRLRHAVDPVLRPHRPQIQIQTQVQAGRAQPHRTGRGQQRRRVVIRISGDDPLRLLFGMLGIVGSDAPQTTTGLTPDQLERVMARQRTVVPGADGTGCVVCAEDWAEGARVVPMPNCAHCMHADCIRPWLALNATCPCCRAPTTLDDAPGAQTNPSQPTA